MQFLKRFFAKIPSFSSSGKHSLAFLNVTQSLGVINDNIFKFTMVFLLIDTLGKESASSILSATGAIYVIPFLLFSASAGILADRFSKQRLLVFMKIAEVAIMILAILAFSNKTVFGCYMLLFLLSIHSALFGPSKYGIISELVPKDSVSKANGLITSFTYLSIIIGTFLASFLTEITDHSFVLIALICLFIAIGGVFSSFAIKPTKPQGSQKKMNLLFVREIYNTLKYTKTIKHLLPSILGSSFFLMLGAFTQLNIIPFAMSSLHLSEVYGGYLFLSTALGIALGAFLAGRASKKKVELGLSCLAGFGIALFFFLLAFFAFNLTAVICSLFFIGVLGGAFIVPFDTFTQLSCDNEKRGQTIASANFLSFLGVLIASFLLFFLNQICNLSPATSFALIGLLTLVVTLLLTFTLSELFLSYFSRKILCPCTKFTIPDTKGIEQYKQPLFILENATWKKALQLAATIPSVHFLIPQDSKFTKRVLDLCKSIHFIPSGQTSEELFKTASLYTEQAQAVCLLLDASLPSEILSQKSGHFFNLFKKNASHVLIAQFKKDTRTGRTLLSFDKK